MNQFKSNHGGARLGAGRPRGSKNKRTEEVEAMLARVGCDPLEILASIASNNTAALGEEQPIPISLRLKAASDLACYVAPRLRSSTVEVSGPQEDQRLVVVADPDFAAMMNDRAGDSIDFRVDGEPIDYEGFKNAGEQ